MMADEGGCLQVHVDSKPLLALERPDTKLSRKQKQLRQLIGSGICAQVVVVVESVPPAMMQ